MNLALFVGTITLTLVACSSSEEDLAPGASDGRACSTTADCGSDRVCGFEIARRCDAKGACFKPVATVCTEQATYIGQSCSGSQVSVNGCNDGLPSSHSPQPLSCHLPDSPNRPSEVPCK